MEVKVSIKKEGTGQVSKDVWSCSRPAGGAVSVVGVVLSLSRVLVIF